MQIKEGLEINNYKDFQKYKNEIFNIIEDTLDLILEETAQKNPTFLIKDYDKLIDYKKVFTIPIENNNPLKVILE